MKRLGDGGCAGPVAAKRAGDRAGSASARHRAQGAGEMSGKLLVRRQRPGTFVASHDKSASCFSSPDGFPTMACGAFRKADDFGFGCQGRCWLEAAWNKLEESIVAVERCWIAGLESCIHERSCCAQRLFHGI